MSQSRQIPATVLLAFGSVLDSCGIEPTKPITVNGKVNKMLTTIINTIVLDKETMFDELAKSITFNQQAPAENNTLPPRVVYFLQAFGAFAGRYYVLNAKSIPAAIPVSTLFGFLGQHQTGQMYNYSAEYLYPLLESKDPVVLVLNEPTVKATKKKPPPREISSEEEEEGEADLGPEEPEVEVKKPKKVAKKAEKPAIVEKVVKTKKVVKPTESLPTPKRTAEPEKPEKKAVKKAVKKTTKKERQTPVKTQEVLSLPKAKVDIYLESDSEED